MGNSSAWQHNPALENILIALEKRGPALLPPKEICKLIQYIKSAVINQGRADESLIVDDNYIIGLPEGGFQREITALTVLAQRLRFSDEFHEWVDNRLRTLAHRMAREHTAEEMSSVWQSMDQNGRLSYLRAVHIMQTNIFKDDDLQFLPLPLALKSRLGRYILGTFSYTGNSLSKECSYEILINPSELKRSHSSDATGVTVHETLHSILRQLARMHHHGEISANHRLYKDSCLMLDTIDYNSYIPSFFREAHKADLEERLCNKHRDFDALYRQQTHRRQLLTDRIAPRPGL